MGHVVEIGEVLVHWRRERKSGREVEEGMGGEVTEWVGEENRQRKRQWMGGEEERERWTHTLNSFSEAVVVEGGMWGEGEMWEDGHLQDGGGSSLRLSAVGDLAWMRVKTNTDPMPANTEGG